MDLPAVLWSSSVFECFYPKRYYRLCIVYTPVVSEKCIGAILQFCIVHLLSARVPHSRDDIIV